MQDEPFKLTRRKALAGLGTIGVAGAGAGLGTSAYFSDEESFTDNAFTAGELDLWVSAHTTYNGATTETNDIGLTDGSALPVALYDLGDVKPGDSGTATICFGAVDNPAWIWVQGIVTANDENGQPEPEQAVDPTTGPGNGELGDELESSLFLDGDGDGQQDSGEEAVYGDLFDGHFSAWRLLPGDGADGQFTATAEPGVDHCVTLDWELPSSVGNVVQSDTLSFDIALYAEQYRHNGHYAGQDVCYASPQNPTADGPAGNQPDFNTERVFELCIDYAASGGELDSVTYDIDLDEPWSDPSEPHANMALGFCGTQDGGGDSLPLDPIADYQIAWRDDDAGGKDFFFSPVVQESDPTQRYTGSGTPVWQYNTAEGWQSLPPGIEATKNGSRITITVDVDPGFPYDPGDVYGIVGNASYGGATHANISTDPANSWSSADNWTSTEFFLPTKIPSTV